METEFDFTKDNHFTMNIGPKMILHIVKQTFHSTAVMYFTDEMNKKINIPRGIVVYDNLDIIEPYNIAMYNQEFHLYWTENYMIEYNKTEILYLKSQRKWDIIKISKDL
jgi:hypothetical protein